MILFFIFSLLPFLHADVEDHLRPVLHTPVECPKGIDYLYLINLDERPEKLRKTLEVLAPHHIVPCRFAAINGWKLPLDVINDLGVCYAAWMMNDRWGTFYPMGGGGAHHEIVSIPGRTYFGHCLAPGSMGCTLSHLSILQDALDLGYETIWVMEDDIEILQDPHLIAERIAELDAAVGKNGWDVLFTDRDTKNQRGDYVPCDSYAWRPNYIPADPYRFAEKKEVSPNLLKIGARYGSYSMILRRSGMRKIFSYLICNRIFLPYDMEYTQPNNIRLFCVKEDIVSTQPQAPSDNGAPNYQ
jgi:GR25 family glycosyltransferase involved in LPS biosynthesis